MIIFHLGLLLRKFSFSGYAAHINFGMTLESVYLRVSMAYLPFQIILLLQEQLCTSEAFTENQVRDKF